MVELGEGGPQADPVRGLSGAVIARTAVRVVWIVVQLTLVICLGQKGTLFFYQGF